MNYGMNSFGDPYADCNTIGADYDPYAPGMCLDRNTGNPIPYPGTSTAVPVVPTNGGGSGGGGVVQPQYQESWASKNRNFLIGAAVVVGVIGVVYYVRG
jgi:hypothetical protein